jgi:Tfp pilus assembly protein FimV
MPWNILQKLVLFVSADGNSLFTSLDSYRQRDFQLNHFHETLDDKNDFTTNSSTQSRLLGPRRANSYHLAIGDTFQANGFSELIDQNTEPPDTVERVPTVEIPDLFRTSRGRFGKVAK